MFKYYKITPLKVIQSFVILGFCFSLCACQYLAKLQDHKQSTSTAVLVKSSPTEVSQLNIVSAEYSLSFTGDPQGGAGSKSYSNEHKVKINARLTLSSKPSVIDKPYTVTLQRPELASAIDVESNSCTEEKAQNHKELAFKCAKTASSSYTLKLSYDLAINQIEGYQELSEGERSYHLVYLPSQLVGKLFIGFNSAHAFPRVITIEGPKVLKFFGHSLLKETEYSQEFIKVQSALVKVSDSSNHQKVNSDKRQTKEKPQISRLTWSNTESDQAYPLFFGFGNWEAATRFEADVKLKKTGNAVELYKQTVELISPLGSQHHRIGKQTLKSLQIKTLKSHAQQLSPIWTADSGSENELQSAKKRPLLFIILPEHPGYQVPDLREYGIIFVDESWFYRYHRFGYAMSQWDFLKVFKDLYKSLQAKITPTSNLAFLEALSWWRSLEHLDGIKHNKTTQTDKPNHYQNYVISLSRDLSRNAMSYLGKTTQDPQLKQRLFASVINMIYQWLYLKKTSQSQNPLEQLDEAISHSVSKLKTTNLSFEDQIIILGQQLNQLESHIKQVLESYLKYASLPLVKVKWTQEKRDDGYKIRFTVSQRPFTSNQTKDKGISIWVIPICFKLGIKDNPPRPHCFVLDQPKASHHELSLEAPLEWVHPNYGQTGLYLWALDSKEFLALSDAESNGLNLAEFLSLSEMSSALLEIRQGSPINYLKSVRELAKSQDQPLSLDALFIHLNRVVHYFGSLNEQVGLVHYFGSLDEEVGQVERWASDLLEGVMFSKTPKYPLNYLTQLQLAQWDRSELSMEQEPKRYKRESAMINKFLRPISGQEAIEEDVAQIKLNEIQYPLLMKALSGNQEFWDKLHQKLSESEDQPLARLILIQSLVQFIDPNLFKKTLDLLRQSSLDQAHVESELQKGEGDKDDVVNPKEKEELQSDDAMNDDEEKQKELSLILRVEDALEMIKAIRSIRAKRLAWSWLLGLKGTLKDKVMYADRIDIQAAMLEWATALCDKKSLSQLKKYDDLGFNQSLSARANEIISEVERCVKIRSLKQTVEEWIKKS